MSDASETVPAKTPPGPPPRGLTPHAPLKRVTVLVNPLSGGVGPAAVDEVHALMAGFACDFAVVEGRDDLADRYIEALEREIGASPPWEPLDAVFVEPSIVVGKDAGAYLDHD